jgi:nucleotide-binding universal stress UspA family protein
MIRRILAAVDFSEATPRCLELAAELAAGTSAELVLLHVAEPEPDFVGYDAGPQSVRDAVAGQTRIEHRRLHDLEASLRGRVARTTSLMVQGPTAAKIVEESKRLGADLVVVGTHGRRGLRQLVLGSVSGEVVRMSACPVLVVRP